MNKFFWTILFLLVSQNIFSQNSFGILLSFNRFNQFYHLPENTENSIQSFENLHSIGGGLFMENRHLGNLSSRIRLSYKQKGFKEELPHIMLLYPAVPENYAFNRFHYIQLDALARLHLNKQTLNPYIITGFHLAYLVAKKMESGYDINQLPFYNPLYDYRFYQKISGGLIANMGIEIRQHYFLELEANIDLVPAVFTNQLRVLNTGLSLNLGYRF